MCYLINFVHIIVQLALGLVVVFVVTTVTAVVGCWCGRKRRQRYQVGGPEKGIPNNDNRNKQQLGLTVSLLDDRKVYTYTLFKCDYILTSYLCMYILYAGPNIVPIMHSCCSRSVA